MIKLRKIKALKYVTCSSCGKDDVDLIGITAFPKKNYNSNRMELCKECFKDLDTYVHITKDEWDDIMTMA